MGVEWLHLSVAVEWLSGETIYCNGADRASSMTLQMDEKPQLQAGADRFLRLASMTAVGRNAIEFRRTGPVRVTDIEP